MFLQMIQGRAGDEERLREQLEVWVREHAEEAEGWLGTTAGVTGDGTFVAVVRFESEALARRNSDRAAQGRWWSETERWLEGPVQFTDCPQASEWLGGGSDEAGFVQVIRSRTTDFDRLLELQRRFDPALQEARPEIIGGVYAADAQDNLVETVYFTSEEEAREGERRMQDLPDELRSVAEEYMSLLSEPRYLDIAQPWLWSSQREA